MAKIVKISRSWQGDKHYGFKLDSLKNDWTKVDKTLLKSSKFCDLKVGDNIRIIARDKRGFVTDFVKLDHVVFVNISGDEVLMPSFNMSFDVSVEDDNIVIFQEVKR